MEFIKKIINIIIIFINILLVLNISSIYIFSDEYIEKEISKVSINDILYSSKFDNNYKVIKIRKSINLTSKVLDILVLEHTTIEELINSDISNSIVIKISINMKNSFKNNKNYSLFNIDDYNEIVDKNIDKIISNDLPIIGSEGKKIVSDSIKKLGNKIIDDIPDTDSITNKIPVYRKVIIFLLSNEKVRTCLVIFDIIFVIILVLMHKSIKVLLDISKDILISSLLLLIINIMLFKYASSFNSEWSFIGRCLTYYNYSIIYNEVILIILSIVFIVSYKVIKKAID